MEGRYEASSLNTGYGTHNYDENYTLYRSLDYATLFARGVCMAVQIASDRMISSTQAARDFSKLIGESQEEPCFILRNNKPIAVVMGLSRYEALQAQLSHLQDLLDHVLLFVEIKAREQDADEEITLEEIEKQHNL